MGENCRFLKWSARNADRVLRSKIASGCTIRTAMLHVIGHGLGSETVRGQVGASREAALGGSRNVVSGF